MNRGGGGPPLMFGGGRTIPGSGGPPKCEGGNIFGGGWYPPWTGMFGACGGAGRLDGGALVSIDPDASAEKLPDTGGNAKK